MNRLRVVAASVLTVAAGMIAAVAAPALASPADDTITVFSAGSSEQASGMLSVQLSATSDITSITAYLKTSASEPDADAPSVSDFVQDPSLGTPMGGTWDVQQSIPWTGADGLAFGTYGIYVSATDVGLTSVTDVFAGTLNFGLGASMSYPQTAPSTIDYANHDVTFSGTLTLYNPDGTTADASNRTISFSAGQGGPDTFNTLTSDTAGDFSVEHEVTGNEYTAQLIDAPDVLPNYAVAGPVFLTVDGDPVTITAHLASTDVNYGATDTVTGKLTYKSGGTSAPLADSPVSVNESYPPGPTLHGVTNGSGDFTIKLPKQTAYSTWTAQYAGSEFFDSASKDLPALNVRLPIALRKVSLKIDAFGRVHAAGCILYTDPQNKNSQSVQPIKVEYSAHKSGPWTVLGSMPAVGGGDVYCPTVTASWKGTFGAKLTNAYYREAVLSSIGTLPAASAPVHLWRIPTRIKSVSVSSRSVGHNGRLTVSGTLQQYEHGWKAYAGRQVLIVLRPAGQKNWYWIAKVHSSRSGHFSTTITDPGNATWSAVYEGDKTHFAGGGKEIYVSASARAALGIGLHALTGAVGLVGHEFGRLAR